MRTNPNPTALTGVPGKRTPGSPVPAGRRQLDLRFPTGAETCQSFRGLEGGAGGNKSLSASTSTGTFYTARAARARGKEGGRRVRRRAGSGSAAPGQPRGSRRPRAARPRSQRGCGGACTFSGVGDPRERQPGSASGMPEPCAPGRAAAWQPRRRCASLRPTSLYPTSPRRQSRLPAAGAPAGREGARGTPGDTRPPPLPFPLPPRGPPESTGGSSAPGPAGLPRRGASGAYGNPAPPERPPSPILLSIPPSSSSLTTSTRTASCRPRPVCVCVPPPQSPRPRLLPPPPFSPKLQSEEPPPLQPVLTRALAARARPRRPF